MKIQHLLENAITAKLEKAVGGRQLIHILYKEIGLLNDTSFKTTDMWDLTKIWDQHDRYEDLIFDVFLIRGDKKWAIIYWDNNSPSKGKFVYPETSNQIKIIDLIRIDIPALRIIHDAIGTEREILRFNTEDVNYLKQKHKSIRHIKDPDEMHDYDMTMHRRVPRNLLPKDKALDERLWIYSPRIFGNAKRHLIRLLDSGEWELPNDFIGSDEELLMNVLNDIIGLKGAWFSPDIHYTNLHGDSMERMWGEFVDEAMDELGYDRLSHPFDSKLIQNILPILSKKANGWIESLLMPKPGGAFSED